MSLLAAVAAHAEAPLSAIDWLSRSVEAPAEGALPDEVTVQPLPEPAAAAGFLAPAALGLRQDLWRRSSADELAKLLRQMPAELPLPLGDALAALVTVDAPIEDPQGAFLVARVDALLKLGRLDAARRLIDVAGSDDPALFRRAFDIALLTGQEHGACRTLQARPDLSPTYPARIFCLAQGGDWQAAALTLESGQALQVMSATETELVARFLHDGEEGLLPPPERPRAVTPLVFRLYEAIGEPLSTRRLPLAFAHADLRAHNGWKTRLEAAERLYRAGAIPDEVLLELYLERAPAASGGVWERAAAVQRWAAAAPEDRSAAATAAAAALAPAGLSRLVGAPAPAPAHAEAGTAPDPDLAGLLAQGRAGEAALNGILRAAAAWEGDADDLSRALATIEAAGLELAGANGRPRWAANR